MENVPENVVSAFIGMYYHAIFDSVESVGKFCGKDSKISYKFNDVNEYTAEGKDAIKKTLENVAEKFTGLEVRDRHFVTVDAENIACVVVGRVAIDDGSWQIFTHNFNLKKGKRNYYLFVDVFRIFGKDIFEDDEEEESEASAVGKDDTVSSSQESKQAQQQQEKPASKPKEEPAKKSAKSKSAAQNKATKAKSKDANPKAPVASNAETQKRFPPKDPSKKGGDKGALPTEKKSNNGGVASSKNGEKKTDQTAPSAKTGKQATVPKAQPSAPPKAKSWADVGASLTSGSSFQNKSTARRPSLGNKNQDNKGKGAGEKKDAAGNGTQGNDKKKPEQGKKDSKIASGINKQSTATILFVKNIDAMATEKELKEFFNKFGNVKNVEKLKRKPTQEKCTAYVSFNSPKSLDRALEETKGSTIFKGFEINIEAAKASVQAAAHKKNSVGGNRGNRGKGGGSKEKRNRRGMKGNQNDSKNNSRNSNNKSRNSNGNTSRK